MVDQNGMTIDGAPLEQAIRNNAIKIKGGDSSTITKNLGDEIEITGKGPVKQVLTEINWRFRLRQLHCL